MMLMPQVFGDANIQLLLGWGNPGFKPRSSLSGVEG